jgi:hypothetical protein
MSAELRGIREKWSNDDIWIAISYQHECDLTEDTASEQLANFIS